MPWWSHVTGWSHFPQMAFFGLRLTSTSEAKMSKRKVMHPSWSLNLTGCIYRLKLLVQACVCLLYSYWTRRLTLILSNKSISTLSDSVNLVMTEKVHRDCCYMECCKTYHEKRHCGVTFLVYVKVDLVKIAVKWTAGNQHKKYKETINRSDPNMWVWRSLGLVFLDAVCTDHTWKPCYDVNNKRPLGS